MSDLQQEKLIVDQPSPVSVKGMKKILFQMENCICIVYTENGRKGTGFFCLIPYLNAYLPVLITNNHVLNESDIENGKIIKLMINNIVKIIKIDNSRKKYTNSDNNIDITIIEIKQNKDGIEIYNYLTLDENDINKNEENINCEYKNKSIYILHYPNGKLKVSYGLINDIVDNKRINHYCNTEEGSSGAPILSLETFKVIGIHCGCYPINIKLNYGTFIKYIIYLFNISYYNQKNKEKSLSSEIFFCKNNFNTYYPGERYYNKNLEQNPGKMTDRINLNLHNPNLRIFSNINNIKYYDSNIINDEENIPSKNGYKCQFIPNSVNRERKSNTILHNYNRIHPNNRKYNETEDNSPELFNKSKSLISFVLDDEKENRIYDNKGITSKLKSKFINENKKKLNLKIDKEKNDRNAQTPISARQSNNIYKRNNNNNEFSISFPQMISNKKEKIYKNMNYNLLINKDYDNGNLDKFCKIKEYIKNKYNIKKNNENDSDDDDRINKYSFEQFHHQIEVNSNECTIPNFDENYYSNTISNREFSFGKIIQDNKSENKNIFKKNIINNNKIFKKYFKQIK